MAAAHLSAGRPGIGWPEVAVESARQRARYATGATLLGGPLGALAGVSTLTVAQARLVIDVAAIIGHDPVDPARAVDVLVLLGVYPDALAASKAVAELVGDVTVLGREVRPARRGPTSVAAATARLLAARGRPADPGRRAR